MTQMPENTPAGYYLHQDGGLYLVVNLAKHSDDASPVVVYQHVWPFEHAVWVRPLSEWTAPRFVAVTLAQASSLLEQDPVEGRAQVTQAKAARKSQQPPQL